MKTYSRVQVRSLPDRTRGWGHSWRDGGSFCSAFVQGAFESIGWMGCSINHIGLIRHLF